MESTIVQEPNRKPKESKSQDQSFVERRRRRRAKISAQLHVRAAGTDDLFEEVCMTADVSRDGLLFMANRKGYWKGQSLYVTFPFSADAERINNAQPAQVVRVSEMADGKSAVAVHFEAASGLAKDARRSGDLLVPGGAAQLCAKQTTVLAVEPDTRTAEMMRNLLAQDGYTVVIVPTAQEALDILRTTVPAVFIAEVEAQDISGHDLCLIIKRNERLQRVPVILLTRSAQPADYTASHQLGAVVCMAKPFQPDRLLHVVRLVAPPPAMRSIYGAPRHMGNTVERAL